ncbi:MAG: ABC transporter [Rhodospirillaceae bacterium]|nr:ABC transporter [Rhodospirillaceae bacterium]
MARKSSTYGGSLDVSSERAKSKELKHLKLLFNFARPYWKTMILAIIALIGAAIGTLGIGRVIQLLIDRGFEEGSRGLSEIIILAYLVVLIISVATFMRYYLVMWLGERVVSDLRASIYKKVIALSPSYFEINKTTEVLSRISIDTTLIQSIVGAGASIALRNLMLLIGGLIMLNITSFKLSLLIMISVPLIILPLIIFGKRVRSLSRETQAAIANVNSVADETLKEIRTVQSYVREDIEFSRFVGRVNSSFSKAKKQIMARGLLTFAVIAVAFGSVVSVLWIGASDVMVGDMTAGDLGAFVVYAIMTAASAAALSEVYGDLQKAAGASERISELLSAKSNIKVPNNPLKINTNPHGNLEFKNVTFAYPSRPEINVLNNFSLEIKSGETVALVGPSGSGKSTIFQLILRFYDPKSGYISFDNLNIIRVDPRELRSNIGVVPQEPVIFDTDVWKNISYSKPNASEAEIISAAQVAAATEFIDRLPDGYNTNLGERGVKLSGGQKQRIAIARSVLHNPSLLLLDEATSSLDTENESIIQASLEKVLKNRTTIIIAHRLSTIQKADRIIVLDKGLIISQGTHEELMKEGGLYAKLSKMQFKNINLREVN